MPLDLKRYLPENEEIYTEPNNKFLFWLKKNKESLIGPSIVFVLIITIIVLYQLNIYSNYTNAIKAYEQKNYALAYEYIQKVNKSSPEYKEVKKYNDKITFYYNVQLGDEEYKKGNYQQAINYYKTADNTQLAQKQFSDFLKERINIASFGKYSDIGFNEYKNGKYKEAIKNYNLAKNAINSTNNIANKAQFLKDISTLIVEAQKAYKRRITYINQLKTHIISHYDEVENLTYYFDSSNISFAGLSHPAFFSPIFLFMTKEGANKRLILRISYFGDSWIFYSSIIFNIDGEKYEIRTTEIGVPHREVVEIGVWESSVLLYDRYGDLINKIINSNKTIMRLSGDKSVDIVITEEQKQAMQRMLDYYKFVE